MTRSWKKKRWGDPSPRRDARSFISRFAHMSSPNIHEMKERARGEWYRTMSDAILPHRMCALPSYDFALIFEISVSYMTRYPHRWHLARILRRIIAHKKRSQYCHVIKERKEERLPERSPGECISARISHTYIRGRIVKGYRIGKSLKSLNPRIIETYWV